MNFLIHLPLPHDPSPFPFLCPQMTSSRSKTAVPLVGQPEDNFSGRCLPTTNEVLKVYFHHHKLKSMSKASATARTVDLLLDVWAKARIPTSEKRAIVAKLTRVVDKYRNVMRNSGRGGDAQGAREQDLLKSNASLFDIAHHNALALIRIPEDRTFLLDQRKERKYGMSTPDMALHRTEVAARGREAAFQARVQKERARQKSMPTQDLSQSDSDSNTNEDAGDEEVRFRTTSFIPGSSRSSPSKRAKAADVVTPAVAAALDRTGVSNYQAVHILAATSASAGQANISLSESSVRRQRDRHRSEDVSKIKESFRPSGPLVVHFDGKKMETTTGGAGREERVAVAVTGPGLEGEKLLTVSHVGRGTGEMVSRAADEALTQWGCREDVSAMSFDTTAANTGLKNGACVLLEQKLGHRLLWLPCRHHILEVVCGDVFKMLFGATSGPSPKIFTDFRTRWPFVNQQDFRPCNNPKVDAWKARAVDFCLRALQDGRSMPRDDYREYLQLCVLFLGGLPPRGATFRAPGADHHARWMSKAIYALKIFLFRHQLQLCPRDLKSVEEFATFAALVYVQPWTEAPLPNEALMNDLWLINRLQAFSEYWPSTADTALKAIGRHLWYTAPELAPLSLFSDRLELDQKRLMVDKLNEAGVDVGGPRRLRLSDPPLEVAGWTMDKFVDESSHFFFEVLHLPTGFLGEDPEFWDQHPDYQQARTTVQALKVVNDTAERGLALATTFNRKIKKSEEGKQELFQTVQEHRKTFPDARKRTVLKL